MKRNRRKEGTEKMETRKQRQVERGEEKDGVGCGEKQGVGRERSRGGEGGWRGGLRGNDGGFSLLSGS